MNVKSKYKTSTCVLLGAVMLLMLAFSAMLPEIAHADPGDLFVTIAGSSLDCTQADPCDLATAILKVQDSDTIYLAAGTYNSTSAAVVSLAEDVSLYGGWDGSITAPIVRDPNLHPTILDGQNARRVVDISAGSAPVLDGLILTNGYGDYSGGGVRSVSSHPTIQNCILQNNHADGDGGAIFINSGSAQILDNQIINNSGNWAGGLRIINNAQVTVRGNFISGNTASNSVGGIDIDCCGGSVVNVEGNWITRNSGGAYGGGVAVVHTDAALVNNIIAENTASEGAGVYLAGMEGYTADVVMINNTLSGLSSSDHAIWLDQLASAYLTNNILSGFVTGIHDNDPINNMISADHNLFYNTSDPVLGKDAIQADPLLDTQYHLTNGSPAINAGIAVQNIIDIDGDPRPNGSYDLGADEYYPYTFLPFVINSAGDS